MKVVLTVELMDSMLADTKVAKWAVRLVPTKADDWVGCSEYRKVDNLVVHLAETMVEKKVRLMVEMTVVVLVDCWVLVEVVLWVVYLVES